MSPGLDPVSAATDWVTAGVDVGVDVGVGELSGLALGLGEGSPLAGATRLGCEGE